MISKQFAATLLCGWFACCSSAYADFRPAILKVTSAGHTAFVVGIAHASPLNPEARQPQIETALRDSGIEVIAVEALPDIDVARSGWVKVFEESQQDESSHDLPQALLDCVAKSAAKSPMYANDRAHRWKTAHAAAALLIVEMSTELRPNYGVYLGTDFMAIMLAGALKLKVAELEQPEASFRPYRNLPASEIRNNIAVYCDILRDERRVGDFRSTGLSLIDNVADSNDPYRSRGLFVAFFKKFGLTNYNLITADARNAGLTTSILELTKAHECSMAMVGQLHLTGDNSIQSLLKSSGAVVVATNLLLQEVKCPSKADRSSVTKQSGVNP